MYSRLPKRYVYFEPHGGINDCMCVIHFTLQYCNKYGRILLINGQKSMYQVNFAHFFKFPQANIICDSDQIRTILNEEHTVYPNSLTNKLADIMDNKIIFTYSKPVHQYNNITLDLPNRMIDESIIIFSKCDGGNGYHLFKQLKIHNNIKKACDLKYNSLKKSYVCIQIRNTDYKCNYQIIYDTHKELLHQSTDIYLATDDKKSIEFFKQKGLIVKNFTTFPTAKYHNLHGSDVESNIKMTDLFCDIYILGMSETLLSVSGGGFIKLIRQCNGNKHALLEQFKPDLA
jgi:hypothetical protein